MNEFVNFNKRDVSLPPGCKDLTDLLRPKTGPSIERPRRLTATRSETVTGVVADVGKYIQIAFESPEAMFALAISTSDGRLEVNALRVEGEEPWVSLTFPKDTEEERVVRKFFARKGLQVPEDHVTPTGFFPKLPVHFIYHISPVPGDAAGVAALMTDFFRQCGKLESNSPLRFQIEAASNAD
jgi:hypothetical protein